MRREHSAPPLLLHIVLEVLVSAVRPVEEMKSRIGREK